MSERPYYAQRVELDDTHPLYDFLTLDNWAFDLLPNAAQGYVMEQARKGEGIDEGRLGKIIDRFGGD